MTNNLSNKGVFLTFEGISDTIFDSQVALHAKEMRVKGVELDIIVFETWPGMYEKSASKLENARLTSQSSVFLYRGIFIYIPFSVLVNAVILFFVILKLKYRPRFIHARADYAASSCLFVSLILNIPIIWDCRGDTHAEFKSGYIANTVIKQIFKSITLIIINFHTYISSKICSQAIFVTDLLRQRKGKYFSDNNSQIIPTSASSSSFYFSEIKRRTMRERLGFNNDQHILIYSGGMVGYQNFPVYIELFRSIYILNPIFHFLIVTPDIKKACSMLATLDNKSYSLLKASFADMNALYNAADYGILIRENNDVNNVASPTKFSEYCLTGLPVIMNDSVKQSYNFALEIGNLIPFNKGYTIDHLPVFDRIKREIISKKAINILSRESNIEKYLSIYTFK